MSNWHELLENTLDPEREYYHERSNTPPSLDEGLQYVLVGFRVELPDVSLDDVGENAVWTAAEQKFYSEEFEINKLLTNGGEYRKSGILDVIATDAHEEGDTIPLGWSPSRVLKERTQSELKWEWHGVMVFTLVPVPKMVVENLTTNWRQLAVQKEINEDLTQREAGVAILTNWGLTAKQIAEVVPFEAEVETGDVKHDNYA